ncbi:MAG: EamA family transporter [Caulobacteraceae bacterium]|nr:EamA family transporter [Caulobacteraceae bacterium]
MTDQRFAAPPPSTVLPWSHVLLALAVVAVWGSNFVVIRVGLDHLPPLLFCTLRFTFALLPAVFFLKRPAVPWSHLAAYGLFIGGGQFGLLFIAMNGHIAPGLASLVMQMQVFFTIGLSVWLAKEKVRLFQLAALALAGAGLAVIAAHTDAQTTPLGLGLTLLASLSWAGGNMVMKASGKVDALAYVVWASLFSIPPLIVLTLVFEGWPAVREGLMRADLMTWGAVLWQSVGNTMFGFAAWGWLLARHPAAVVTPAALLVPVFGMSASALLLAEPLPGWKLLAALLVLAGLAVIVVYPRLRPT